MNVFRTFIIPAALGPKAVAICDALGYPDKGMFTAKVADGDQETAPAIAYMSSGIVDSASPVLGTAADLFTACKGAAGITLADCQAFKLALLLSQVNRPHEEKAEIVKECNGTATAPAWVQPTGAHDAYPLGASVTHNAKKWRSLIPANVWAPGVSGWREHWSVGNEWPAWVQPTGAHDAYGIGAKVTFNTKRYSSLIAANVWSPTGYPAGWKLEA